MGFKSGADNPRWNGGRCMNQGYILVKTPGHPNPVYADYVYEHRLVMEKHLGRYLDSVELVHHKDGNRLNNSIDNLEIITRADHNRVHVRCPEGRPENMGANDNWKKLKRDNRGRFYA